MHGTSGARLTDITQSMGLEPSTTHRIVKGLVSHGMVTQDTKTKTYRLGHLVYELGLAASPNYALKEICRPTLERLADKSGDSVFLVVRSGLDSVCIDRVEGSYPIQTRTLEIGGRRPLGVGAASLALLMTLSAIDRQKVIETNASRFSSFGQLTVERLNSAIKLSTKMGYAINEGDVLSGVCAIGLPITPKQGKPYAALSIAGIASRFTGNRRKEIADLLIKETQTLEKNLNAVNIDLA
jgi:DNA-binding IclR family transcriptional regulator